MNKYDYIVVGSGFFGAICAYELTKKGYKCLVLEKRKHIGGNCYTSNRDGINVHDYGPHVFHTSNEEVWRWINQFVSFNSFNLNLVANYKNEIYPLPFNMYTFSKILNVVYPYQAKDIIREQGKDINEPANLEEQSIKSVGKEVYEKLIKGYVIKQWRKHPKNLPKEIIKRLPVRFTYDNNYYNDSKYQGIPIGGYTPIFEKLLEGIEVKLGMDYLKNKKHWDLLTKKIIYTGAIDRFFNYKFGELEYKTTKFIHKKLPINNYQGTAIMSFTEEKIPYTRIIEHKHFENVDVKNTWLTWEYPVEYKIETTEPYYPVNDEENNLKYSQYKNLADRKRNTVFGGRLAEYKYYDMHEVIESALNFIKTV